MIQEIHIRKLIDDFLADKGIFLVKLNVTEGNIIEALIDGDENISITDCVGVSRAVESNLNREEEDFELKVSSYGADRPLIHERQIQKAVGKRITIKIAEEKKMKGELLEFDGKNLLFVEIKPPAKKGGKEKRKEEQTIELDSLEEIRREIMFK